jgi:sulfate permease, SulP family
MAVELSDDNGPSRGWRARTVLRDAISGAICGGLSIAFCLSYAALIFTGPIAHWLSYGVAVTLLSAAVAGAVMALRSSLPTVIAGPDNSTSAAMALFVAVVVDRLAAAGVPQRVETILTVVAIVTAVAAVLLYGLGVARAGRAIRFVPYPVIGGFLGATGWLMIVGAIRVVTDHQLTLGSIDGLLRADAAAKLGAGLAVAAALHFMVRDGNAHVVLPSVLLAGIVLPHLALLLSGIPIAEAQAGGWLFQPQTAAALPVPWSFDALREFPWWLVPSVTGELLGVMFVATMTLLVNTTAIEVLTRREADLERELRAIGLANLLCAAVGGVVACTTLGRTTLARLAGAAGRLAGFIVAAISGLALLIDPALVGYLPKFVLGGLLFFLGAGLFNRWLVQSSWQLRPLEYASLIAIALLIVKWGFVAGVLIGVVIGCAIFAYSASRVNTIKFGFSGSDYRSSLDRSPDELRVLAEHGAAIQGVALQSYLFFGSANLLYQEVKALLAREPKCRFLLFDFKLVTGIDSSATQSFLQIRQAAAKSGATIVMAGMAPELQQAFEAIGFLSGDVTVSADLDHALELCEQRVIEAHRAGGGESPSFRAWLSDILGSPHHADRIADSCKRLEFRAGDVVTRHGATSDSMYFIFEGRIGVIVELEHARMVRVRSLGRYTTVGEMGLIARQPRSGTLQAEADSVLYELSAGAYEALKSGDPGAIQALVAYVATVMAARLGHASRAIGVLQR